MFPEKKHTDLKSCFGNLCKTLVVPEMMWLRLTKLECKARGTELISALGKRLSHSWDTGMSSAPTVRVPESVFCRRGNLVEEGKVVECGSN